MNDNLYNLREEFNRILNNKKVEMSLTEKQDLFIRDLISLIFFDYLCK